MSAQKHVVSAHPGFSIGWLIEPEKSDSVLQVEWLPILAWLITLHEEKNHETPYSVDPMVPGGNLTNDYVIKLPDGRIQDGCGDLHRDWDAFFALKRR